LQILQSLLKVLNVSSRIAHITLQSRTDGSVLGGLPHVVGGGDERLFTLDLAKDVANGSIVGHFRKGSAAVVAGVMSVLSRLPDYVADKSCMPNQAYAAGVVYNVGTCLLLESTTTSRIFSARFEGQSIVVLQLRAVDFSFRYGQGE